MTWEDAKKVLKYIKEHGVVQFLHIYNERKDWNRRKLLWGDEIEYLLIKRDAVNRTVKLSLRGHDLLPLLQKPEHDNPDQAPAYWRPEYGSFQIEGTPGQPYVGDPSTFIYQVEQNMTLRRQQAHQFLEKDEIAVSLANFPLLGVGDFCTPSAKAGGPTAQSLFTPDEMINHHPRFSTLTANIRERRGHRVDMRVPLFKDSETADYPLHPDRSAEEVAGKQSEHWPEPGVIYMDSMAFGMGMCCLQVTFQCCNIAEARHFYDQLAVVAPIMLALSAATPIFRGFLSEQDARWNVIAGSVDDRNDDERNPASPHYVPKSRYDSISTYIGTEPTFKPEYNDLDLKQNTVVYEQLREAGIDESLARHVAHLFIRDPLVMYEGLIELDDNTRSDHFENIQSTNWQTVRFKPPPPGSSISWRVEFRPLEVQLTDFENAAFSVFIVLLTRAIMAFDLNLYEPISLVDINMKRAHRRDAINKEKFWFRKCCSKGGVESEDEQDCDDDTSGYEEMTIDEIINGSDPACGVQRVGLVGLIGVYLDSIGIGEVERAHIDRYLELIKRRASGELISAATWQRRFVRSHPDYKNDSIVSHTIAHDLIVAAHELAEGKRDAPELYADLRQLPPQPSSTSSTFSSAHFPNTPPVQRSPLHKP